MAVYFIKDESTGFVKIGYSDKPNNRLKSLQTSSANKLTLVKTVEGDRTLEFALHEKFAKHKVRGEWFSLPSIDEAIAATCSAEQRTQTAWKEAYEETRSSKEYDRERFDEERKQWEVERKQWTVERAELIEQRDRLLHQRDELAKATSLPKLLVYALKFHKEGKL